MKKYIFILILLFITALSCEESLMEKPENLIKEKQMIDMIVDVHIAEATFYNRKSRDSLVSNSSSVNFYYSVLENYEVADSVFEKSFVYYAGQPKKFEKMYRQVASRLSELEQEFIGRKGEELDFGTRELE